MTEEDALDMFAELPQRVRTAIISHMHSLRRRWRVDFTDYDDMLVAQYIAASQLLQVDMRGGNGVRFKANENTAHLYKHLHDLLNLKQ